MNESCGLAANRGRRCLRSAGFAEDQQVADFADRHGITEGNCLLHCSETCFNLVLGKQFERRDRPVAQPLEMCGGAWRDLELDLVERYGLETRPPKCFRRLVNRGEHLPLDLERAREVTPPSDVTEAVAELRANADQSRRLEDAPEFGGGCRHVLKVVDHKEEEREVTTRARERNLLGAPREVGHG